MLLELIGWAGLAVFSCCLLVGYLVKKIIDNVQTLLNVADDPIEVSKPTAMFSGEKLPKEVDCVVIGAGISGLSVGALLAKSGKRVLVLEQHDEVGGSTHVFLEKGVEFDTGVHYVGEVGYFCDNNIFFNYVSDGQLKWAQMDSETSDYVSVGDLDFPIASGFEECEATLKRMPSFAKNGPEISAYMRLVQNCEANLWPFGLLKLLPRCICKFLLRFPGIFKNYNEISQRSIGDKLDEITDNQLLKAVLSYNFGDLGVPPKHLPAFLQTIVFRHFVRCGTYFPVGGSGQIGNTLSATIVRRQGQVLLKSNVTEILVDEEKNCVTGVVVKKNLSPDGRQYVVKCPMVVSTASLPITAGRLLPERVCRTSEYLKALGSIALDGSASAASGNRLLAPGCSCVIVFLSFSGSPTSLNLPAYNHWIFGSENVENEWLEYASLDVQDAASRRPPLIFASFPSAKDPTWSDRFAGRSNCILIGLANYDWFAEWRQQRVNHRDADYESLKAAFRDSFLDLFLKHYPHLDDKIDNVTVATPVTSEHYLAQPFGQIYGSLLTYDRFTPEGCYKLRPDTDVEGLYVSGQDIATPGVCGATFSGIVTGQAVLGKPLFLYIQLAVAWRMFKCWLASWRCGGASANGKMAKSNSSTKLAYSHQQH